MSLQQILHLRWPHAGITGNQNHVVGNSPIPDARGLVGLANPLSAYGVELAIFLQRELVTPHCLELRAILREVIA
jgi:hypothetical protein